MQKQGLGGTKRVKGTTKLIIGEGVFFRKKMGGCKSGGQRKCAHRFSGKTELQKKGHTGNVGGGEGGGRPPNGWVNGGQKKHVLVGLNHMD